MRTTQLADMPTTSPISQDVHKQLQATLIAKWLEQRAACHSAMVALTRPGRPFDAQAFADLAADLAYLNRRLTAAGHTAS